jgi:Matrixin
VSGTSPTRARLAAAAAAVVILVLLVVGIVVWRPWGTSAGNPVEGSCVAAPGVEEEDVDPNDSPEVPWPRVPGGRVVVHFAVGGLPARYIDLVGHAASLWARSPCVEPVVVDTCPTGSNCSTVVARAESDDEDTDGESESVDSGGVRQSNTIVLYTRLLDESSDNGALATIVHEMGHALGLVHRNDRDSVMNAETDDSTNPVPDAVDFANLVVLYG